MRGSADLLRSAAASGMGLTLALGVVAVGVRRPEPSVARRRLDVVALAASVVIPLAMTAGTGTTGLLQRTMFLIARVW